MLNTGPVEQRKAKIGKSDKGKYPVSLHHSEVSSFIEKCCKDFSELDMLGGLSPSLPSTQSDVDVQPTLKEIDDELTGIFDHVTRSIDDSGQLENSVGDSAGGPSVDQSKKKIIHSLVKRSVKPESVEMAVQDVNTKIASQALLVDSDNLHEDLTVIFESVKAVLTESYTGDLKLTTEGVSESSQEQVPEPSTPERPLLAGVSGMGEQVLARVKEAMVQDAKFDEYSGKLHKTSFESEPFSLSKEFSVKLFEELKQKKILDEHGFVEQGAVSGDQLSTTVIQKINQILVELLPDDITDGGVSDTDHSLKDTMVKVLQQSWVTFQAYEQRKVSEMKELKVESDLHRTTKDFCEDPRVQDTAMYFRSASVSLDTIKSSLQQYKRIGKKDRLLGSHVILKGSYTKVGVFIERPKIGISKDDNGNYSISDFKTFRRAVKAQNFGSKEEKALLEAFGIKEKDSSMVK
eukprot:COSAG01_NODE_5683_length_4102_cov_19.864352_4_plen_461_part_01